MTETQTVITPRLRRDQCHLFFDPNEPPAIRVAPGTRLVVETEDAHRGSIRTEQDIYPTLASVFERLGGANPVTGPIYVEGVEPGDCIALTIEEIVPGPVQGQVTRCFPRDSADSSAATLSRRGSSRRP
jgi:acetamidase/formamidase